MPSKRKVPESYWTPQVIENTFRLDGDTTELLRKYFPSDEDIHEINYIISEYLFKNEKQENRPEMGKTRESLLKFAEFFEILQDSTYPLYLLKLKIKNRKIAQKIGDIIFELENDKSGNNDINAFAIAAREAAEEIEEKPPKGGSIKDYPGRGLVADIAELYKKNHGVYPLRPNKFANSKGSLDDIIGILAPVIACGTMQGLIHDYDGILREKTESK